jgi:TonB family protein
VSAADAETGLLTPSVIASYAQPAVRRILYGILAPFFLDVVLLFMLRTTYMVIVIVLLASLSLQAQEDHVSTPFKKPGGDSNAAPGMISKDELVSHGFSFDDRKRPTCKISGSEGTCHVRAFVGGEKDPIDEAAHTCTKLDRASYVGHCVHGNLDGLALVIADGSTKQGKEAFLSYFLDGRIAYPALTSDLTGGANFGVDEKRRSYGCVYFGKWDDSARRCGRFIQIYGPDIFTESNAQKLRDGGFDLTTYRAKFLEFVSSSTQPAGTPQQPNPVPVPPHDLDGMVIQKVPPVYPPEAVKARVQGSVVLAVTIGKDGTISSLRPLSGSALLVDAAIEAVRQWRYKPFTFNGEPVAVDTTITVNFQLNP